MTAETKKFPTADVLSSITGRLMADISGVYDVLGWMTGEKLFTHQLPRIGREATPAILALHPELAAAVSEADQVNRDNFQDWLALWVSRYGETITVPKLTADEHERIDPLSEAAEKFSPDRIIIVEMKDPT